MHDGPFAFEVSTYASVMSMVFGSILFVMFRWGLRLAGMIPLVSAWYGASLYFFLLAVSAGHHPLILRLEIALVSRLLLMLIFTIFGFAYVSFFVSFVRASNKGKWLW